MSGAVLLWLRQDLRLSDHNALQSACRLGLPIIPLYIWSPEEEGEWPAGSASRAWLYHSLKALTGQLAQKRSRLILKSGPVQLIFEQLVQETGATHILCHKRYEPAAVAQEIRLAQWAFERGVRFQALEGALLIKPERMLNRQGTPYQVYTPFCKVGLQTISDDSPLSEPEGWRHPAEWPTSLSLEALNLLPVGCRWDIPMMAGWQPGEVGAQVSLQRFSAEALGNYEAGRNLPVLPGSSRLSPHLHYGEISPRQVWHAVHQAALDTKTQAQSAQVFLKELVWREFAHYLLAHFPQTPKLALKEPFQHFPWQENPKLLRAWSRGETGYPFVDAGMRELWATGWMHNRVRMVVASFLVKHLLIPWQQGAAWFWDTLMDADLANNTLGWQWVAGCGADAAPYFRIFNPMAQGVKFDPQGEYIRQWLPELVGLPDAYIHQPWEAPSTVLQESGVTLGRDYPYPLVDHAMARNRALAAYEQIKRLKS